MTVETVIADMISETITAKGFDLVRVKFDRKCDASYDRADR